MPMEGLWLFHFKPLGKKILDKLNKFEIELRKYAGFIFKKALGSI